MDGMGWVRSEHPGSIGFGVKHIGHIHVAFRRMDATLPTNNEEKHGTHVLRVGSRDFHHRLKRAKREKGVSSREVKFRLSCTLNKVNV